MTITDITEVSGIVAEHKSTRHLVDMTREQDDHTAPGDIASVPDLLFLCEGNEDQTKDNTSSYTDHDRRRGPSSALRNHKKPTMRRSSPNAARLTTILSLFLLISLSFVVLFRGDSFAPAAPARPIYKRSHLILRAEGDQPNNGSASAAPSSTPSSTPVSLPESPSSTPSSTPVTPSSSSQAPEVTDALPQSSSSASFSEQVTPSSSSAQDVPSST